MWILARALLSVLALAARLRRRLGPLQPQGDLGGTPYFVITHTHKGKVTELQLGMPLKTAVALRLTREGLLDRFFKACGLSEEIQTGDGAFDPSVYIACDHPFVAECLRRNAAARELVLEVMRRGFGRIWTDGEKLWMSSTSVFEAAATDLRLLDLLQRALLELESGLPSRLEDAFLRRALFMEGLSWAIAAYALAAFIEFTAIREDVYLDPARLITAGCLASLLLFLGLMALAVTLLRGSSRGHRFLAETGILLLLGLPLAGPQLVSDLNRAFDRFEPILIERRILRAEIEERRRRRGRRYKIYHLYLEPSRGASLPVSDHIRVAGPVFVKAAPGRVVRLRIGRGWLGHRWYRAIEVLQS